MDYGLHDQVVLVTGASKGIGFACAQAFAREGARVAIASRSRANLDAALAMLAGGRHPVAAFASDLVHANSARTMIDDVARKAVLFQLEVPASAFTPGIYTCQVNVIDAVAGKVAFPRLSFQVR